MVQLAQIRDLALTIALGQVGVREDPKRANTGPEVNRYLQAVGLPPGHHWCAAFVVWAYARAAEQLGVPNPLKGPGLGKVTNLWRYARPLWRSGQPSRGAIFCHLVNPLDPMSAGHCGLVTRLEDFGELETIEGNTNAQGSRVGDRVRINNRTEKYVNLGYIDIGRLGPPPARILHS